MKIKKIFAAVCFISLAATCFAEESTAEKLEKAKASLSTQLSSVSESLLSEFEVILPEANSLSGVQPDAYIGKVFPSLPPHFAVGITASVTPIKADFIADNFDVISSAVTTMLDGVGAIKSESGSSLLDAFKFDFKVPNKIPYPAASVNARVGGLFLPFDMGVWAVTTGNVFHDKAIGSGPVLDFEYTAFGVDVRYAILEGNLVLPKVSVGAGYQFVRQNVGVAFSKDFTIDSGYKDPDNKPITGDATIDSAFNVKLDTHTFFGQIQVSKTLFIVTPYLGLKALFTTSNCAYDWKYETTVQGNKYDALSDGDGKNYKHSISDLGIQTQVFGGASLNFLLFQTTFNAAYNFSSKLFTGTLGMNVKL